MFCLSGFVSVLVCQGFVSDLGMSGRSNYLGRVTTCVPSLVASPFFEKNVVGALFRKLKSEATLNSGAQRYPKWRAAAAHAQQVRCVRERDRKRGKESDPMPLPPRKSLKGCGGGPTLMRNGRSVNSAFTAGSTATCQVPCL